MFSNAKFVLCLTLCHFVLVFFSPFSIAITSLGEERANLNAFRTFVRFVLVWIPSAPAYGVYVSQFIRYARACSNYLRYARACSNYQDFVERGKVLTTKLLSQGYQKTKLVATFKKFYGRHHDLVNAYNVAVSRLFLTSLPVTRHK